MKLFWFPFLAVLLFANPALAQIEVCLLGDSHFERGSALPRYLQEVLGEEYHVTAHGRRGWTTRRWLRHLDEFVQECHEADIILISLGGNDRASGFDREEIRRNLDLLMEAYSELVYEVYHICRPSDYYRGERPELFDSLGIHLNRRGAKEYAQILAELIE
jgi:lysophospholipase L1-like esterase